MFVLVPGSGRVIVVIRYINKHTDVYRGIQIVIHIHMFTETNTQT